MSHSLLESLIEAWIFFFFLVLWNLIKTKIVFKRRTSEGAAALSYIEMLKVRKFFNHEEYSLVNYFERHHWICKRNFHWTSYEDWDKNLIWKSRASWTYREKERERRRSNNKISEIFQLNYEKFLLPMHDIYEIIMFSSTNPTASRIQSNRDNMNFSSLCFLESAFYVTRLYAFWIFHSFSCGKKEFVGIKKS